MNEVVETIYQWHTGMKIHHISLSLGLDRKTVRKYLGMARSLGVTREGPLPDEEILAGRLKNLMTEKGACYDKPAIHLIARHHDEIQTWLTDKDMTGKLGVAALKGNPRYRGKLHHHQALSQEGVCLRQTESNNQDGNISRRGSPG